MSTTESDSLSYVLYDPSCASNEDPLYMGAYTDVEAELPEPEPFPKHLLERLVSLFMCAYKYSLFIYFGARAERARICTEGLVITPARQRTLRSW